MKTTQEIIAEVGKSIMAERRYERSIRRMEMLRRTVAALPPSTLKAVQRELNSTNIEMRAIALRHKLPHNLIIWIWRHHNE